MSASTLPERIKKFATLMGNVETLLAGSPGKIPNTSTEIRQLTTSHDVQRWSMTIEARMSANKIMAKLVDQADPVKNTVELSGVSVPFRIGRHLAVQAYLSTTWALAP